MLVIALGYMAATRVTYRDIHYDRGTNDNNLLRVRDGTSEIETSTADRALVTCAIPKVRIEMLCIYTLLFTLALILVNSYLTP
jgi:hypothetical protein